MRRFPPAGNTAARVFRAPGDNADSNRTAPFGDGRYEFCALDDGFYIAFGDIALDAPKTTLMSFPDMVRVYVANRGDGEYMPPGGDRLSLAAPNTAIVIEPAGVPPTDTTFAGCTRFVCVFIHRAALKSLYAGCEHELPDALQAFLDGDLKGTVARPLPVDATLLRCLEDVHATQLEGRRRRLLLQAKAIEIVCHAIEAFEYGDDAAPANAKRLTMRCVLKAQRLLSENFVSPPSLDDIAHQVGMSRTTLCTGFRQVVGKSVFDYIHDLRMDEALALLNGQGGSIAEIAHAVGYHRASSFSVAVQRHFGVTPTELRRRGAAAAQ